MEKKFEKLFVLDHPLITHKLSLMRDKQTSTNQFRLLLKEIALLMGYEVTRELPIRTEDIETPVGPTTGKFIAGKKMVVVPILRAGLGMADGLLELVPSARVGHIGVYRDPDTLSPVEYLAKLPGIDGRTFIVVDPMLATGNSAVHAIDTLVSRGVDIDNIKFMALVAAPEGVKRLVSQHPKIEIFVAALDEKLNDHAYIVPGLGDAGDRLFGTK
ncbi:MAG: Uracil phosphoribosyltransferase [Alphaproteobacteria bacterium MarineAlpha2_Bin1]|nr:MAG: Uracil phosphoribosyltransferase [Alphaproteobacteria bacterium MarineAlpha2_Bin1]